MQRPTVTVLMPVYNTARFVRPAVESILAQTCRDFELVIIDDGSTDASPRILRDLAARDSRIRLLIQANQGVSATRNRLISLARGRYIAFMDSDDLSMPERLEQEVRFLEDHPECVAVGTGKLLVCEYGLPLEAESQPLEHEQIDHELLCGNGAALTQGTSMMRREAVVRLGGFNSRYRLAEDMELLLRLALVGRLANLPAVCLHYRQRIGSIMHTRTSRETALLHEMLIEAHRARGLEPPTRPPVHFTARVDTESDCLRRWGWNALKLNRPDIARKYALQLLRHRAGSLRTLKLVACALRGH